MCVRLKLSLTNSKSECSALSQQILKKNESYNFLQQKFEGLTLYKKTATHIELLLCEDNDSEVLETTIYSLRIKR